MTTEEKIRELAEALGLRKIWLEYGRFQWGNLDDERNLPMTWNPFEDVNDLRPLWDEIERRNLQIEFINLVPLHRDNAYIGADGWKIWDTMTAPPAIHAEAAWQVLCKGEEKP